jgi:hypothetical protein
MQLPNFLGVFSVLVLAVAWSASADEIVIMPIGDSITAGYHGSPSGVYRDLLQDKLSAENIPFDMVVNINVDRVIMITKACQGQVLNT